jgi:hypothetical protein
MLNEFFPNREYNLFIIGEKKKKNAHILKQKMESSE